MNTNSNNNTNNQAFQKAPILASGVTKVGIAVFPHLSIPDTKFDEAGVYKTTLRIKEEDCIELLQVLDECAEKSVQLAQQGSRKAPKKAPPVYSEAEIQGYFDIRFKSKASFTGRDGARINRKLPIVDGKGMPVPSSVLVTGGSKIALAYDVVPYHTALVGAGITLRIKAVQVLSLATEAPTFETFGFSVVEDGLDVSVFSKDADDTAPVPTGRTASAPQEASKDDEDDEEATNDLSFNF